MRESTEGAFCLRAAGDGGIHPVLWGVQARGRLDGLLFSLTLRQTYRNTSPRTLEVVYTFPLPMSAVLLDFAAEFDGRRIDCQVMPRAQAEQEYESALAEGDAPALLEAGADGLYTANVGNLKPGEEVVLEIRFAQLVAFEQGRLRLAVPMTIAPRYGNAAASGLAPHQVPEVATEADYPLDLSVRVMGDLVASALECPTHRASFTVEDGAVRVDLSADSRLDRDVVLLVTPQQARPQVLTWSDNVALAAFELSAAPRPRAGGLSLKLLVDCSGSMGGDSIASARRALMGALGELQSDDQVAYVRFGSSVEVDLRPSRCNARTLDRLREAVLATDATLGGTEMEGALEATFELRSRSRAAASDGADVLLITDGEVWDVAPMIAAARRSGHRVFVIGVGASPAEAVIRRLAQATGGACEFATPGEALEAAARRMFLRMRQEGYSGLRVDWGAVGAPKWELPVAPHAFGGDTVLAIAGFAQGVEPDVIGGADGAGVRLTATAGNAAQEIGAIRSCVFASGDELPRIAASRRIEALHRSEAEGDDSAVAVARELALQYRLVTRHTHAVLVHRRAEEDKATEEAQLHRVSSMLAAGWGGQGRELPQVSLMASSRMKFGVSAGGGAGYQVTQQRLVALNTRWRSARSQASPLPSDALCSMASFRDDVDPWLDESNPGSHPPLLHIVAEIADHLAGGGQVRGLASLAAQFQIEPRLQQALDELRSLHPDDSTVWLLLTWWVAQRPGRDGNARMAEVMADPVAQLGLRADELTRVHEVLQRHLGKVRSRAWTMSRQDRLREAMGIA